MELGGIGIGIDKMELTPCLTAAVMQTLGCVTLPPKSVHSYGNIHVGDNASCACA